MKVTSNAPLPPVTIELTGEEAKLLMELLGYLGGTGTHMAPLTINPPASTNPNLRTKITNPLWTGLNNAGVQFR